MNTDIKSTDGTGWRDWKSVKATAHIGCLVFVFRGKEYFVLGKDLLSPFEPVEDHEKIILWVRKDSATGQIMVNDNPNRDHDWYVEAREWAPL